MTQMKAAEYYTAYNQPPTCHRTNIPANTSDSKSNWVPLLAQTLFSDFSEVWCWEFTQKAQGNVERDSHNQK